MIMVLAIHANFFSTGILTTQEATALPLQSMLRSFAHALCVGAVNTFIMISGYFGIRYRNKGLASIIFQSLFFCISIYLIMLLLGLTELSKINIASTLLLFKQADCYWFVWAYIILYILAPVINSFTGHVQKKEFERTILLFFTLQLVLDATPFNNFFIQGFSPLSFIGIYMLAQYIKRFTPAYTRNTWLSIFIICVITNTVLEYSIKRYGIDNGIINSIINGYTNPITVIQSLALLLYFTKIRITNNLVNWTASSCFAVYLFHMHFCIVGYYRMYALNIWEQCSGFTYLLTISLMITAFFISPVLIDKIRIFCFNKFWDKIEKYAR